MALKNLLPLLNVSDIEASLEFYRDAFDFAVVSDPAAVKQRARIRSGWTETMLSQTGSPSRPGPRVNPHSSSAGPVNFYFYADAVARLYAQVIARGFEPGALQDTEQADSEQRL